eukprot:578176_1
MCRRSRIGTIASFMVCNRYRGGRSRAMCVIGISSKENHTQNIFSTLYQPDPNEFSYGYNGYSGSSVRALANDSTHYKSYATTFEDGAVVDMDLNLKDKTLRYSVNGENQGIAHSNIKVGDITYRLAIYLGGDVDSVTITSYSTEVLSDDLQNTRWH